MAFILLIIAIACLYFLIRYLRDGNHKTSHDANNFSQAGVSVDFAKGLIRVGKSAYKVNDVTGITAEPFGRNILGKYDDKNWRAVIELDDLDRPRHTINFSSQKAAKEFTQRICIALRKAGGHRLLNQ